MYRKLQLLLTLLLALPIGMLAAGTTWQSATEISINGSANGTLSESNEEQWYWFAVTEDGQSELTVTPSGKLNVWDVTLYTYSGDQTDIVQRNIVGIGTSAGTMTTTDLAPGTYFIRVRRYSESGSYTLTSKYTPNPFANDGKHDDWTTAKWLEDGKSARGHLGYSYFNDKNEEDWYYINVNVDGQADITIDPDQTFGLNVWDLTLYTYNEDQTDLVQRNIKGIGKELSTMTTTDLAPGTYFIRVRRYDSHGGYTLSYKLTPNPFANDGKHDDWTTAKALGNGQTVQGHLGYCYFKDTNEEDWYYINVNADRKADITINPDQTFALNVWDLTLYTYNEDQTDIVQRNIKGIGKELGTMTTTDLAPGIYYLRVRRYGDHGGYTLSYQLTPNPFANDGKHDDWMTAKWLEDGKTVQGHLGYLYFNDRNEEDWYCYEVTADGKLDITINPSQTFNLNVWDVTLYTYNGDQTDIVQRNIKGIGKELGTMTTTNLAPGVYFLRVRRYGDHGGYRLKALLTPNGYANDPEPNNEWTQAVALEANKTVTGHLGYNYFNNTDEEDWYMIQQPAKGTVTLTIHPDQEFGLNIWDVTLYGYNSDQTDITQKGISGVGREDKEFVVNDIDAGTYFVKVRRYSDHGSYLLKYGTKLDKVEPTKPEVPEDIDDINSTEDPLPGDNPTPGPGPDDPGYDVTDQFTLWYTLDSGGGTVAYKLAEKPQVRLLGAETTVTSSRGVMTFETTKIWKFTLDTKGSPVGIDETPVQQTEGSVSRGDDALIFSGCRPGEPVFVYTTGGALVSQQRIGADGTLELPLGTLRPGMYIVKAGSVNLKFMKK